MKLSKCQERFPFVSSIVILTIFILLMETSCSPFKSSASQKPLRFRLGDSLDPEKKSHDNSASSVRHSPGETHVKSGKFALRGTRLQLNSSRKKFDITPRVSGDYIFLLDIVLGRHSPEKHLGLRIYVDRVLQVNKKHFIRGVNHLRFQCTLSRKSQIHIVFSGKGNILLGDVILIADIPRHKRDYVFLFSADTLRADHLPVYGYGRDTAPRIDEFCRDVVIFENAYAPSAWTLPSHMSLFTCRNEYAHGAKRGSTLSAGVPYLVEDISEVALTRSINGGIFVSSRFGFHRGFDYFFSISQDQTDPFATQKLALQAETDLQRNLFASGFYFLHTYQVHSPYNPAQRFLTALGLDPVEKALVLPNVATNHREQYLELPPERIQNYIDLYDAEIRALDEGFGHFLDFLRAKGIYDRSLIIFFSDHGEEFYEHGGWGHCHSLYNELIHVPLLVKFPGNKYGGKRISTPAKLVNIMPTILDHYGIPLENRTLDGCRLTDLIQGKPRKKPLLSTLTSGRYIPALPFKISVIENRRKLICSQPYTKRTMEFFNPPPRSISAMRYMISPPIREKR